MISARLHCLTARLLAVLLLVTGWGVPLAFPHAADDDLLCVVLTADDAGASSLDKAAAVRAADHCAVCHSLRSFRAGGLDSGTAVPGLSRSRLVPSEAALSRTGQPFHRLPARAPPA